MEKLEFIPSGWGDDFEAEGGWPEGWPSDIVEDGRLDYGDPFVKFKGYDTSYQADDQERVLFAHGYRFQCEVKLCYETDSLWCEDVISRFPARDREEAKRLLQVAADALYGEPPHKPLI